DLQVGAGQVGHRGASGIGEVEAGRRGDGAGADIERTIAAGVDDADTETHPVARVDAGDVAVDAADVGHRGARRERLTRISRWRPGSARTGQGVVPFGVDVRHHAMADLQVRLVELDLDDVLVGRRFARGVVLRRLRLRREVQAIGEGIV